MDRGRKAGILVLVIAVVVLFLLWWSGVFSEYGFGMDRQRSDRDIAVYFLDVGQGDSTLIRSQSHTILIDAGTEASEKRLLNQLRAFGVQNLDVLILTHPDGDHIGGADGILSEYSVGLLILPDGDAILEADAGTLAVVTAAEEKQVPVRRVRTGDSLELAEMKLDFLGPIGRFYEEINDYSVVTRLSCGEVSFLFPGDAGAISESELLEVYGNQLKSTFLHVGHHGAKTSTSKEFLQAVAPEYALISCGEGNAYGHPDSLVLELLEASGVIYFRTDLEGSIVIVTDGKTIRRGKWNP